MPTAIRPMAEHESRHVRSQHITKHGCHRHSVCAQADRRGHPPKSRLGLLRRHSLSGAEVVPPPHKPCRVPRCFGAFDGTITTLTKFASDPDSLEVRYEDAPA